MANRVVATIFCNDKNLTYTQSISSSKDVFICLRLREYAASPRLYNYVKNITWSGGGSLHIVFLDVDGNVFTLGSNNYGQLGIGIKVTSTPTPRKVILPPIKQVSCCNLATICLSENGELYSFGSNTYGQLGLGNTEHYDLPQKITSLNNIDFVECGSNFAFCKTLDDIVYCWGDNYRGQLGNEDITLEFLSPVECNSIGEIVDIKCGKFHTILLNSEGEVFKCGIINTGEDEETTFQKVEGLPFIIRIECGESSCMFIDKEYNLYVFGRNDYGQLGLGNTINMNFPIKHPTLSNVIDVSKGGYHTFVKTISNEIFAFGYNSRGQLGIETENNTPINLFEQGTIEFCQLEPIQVFQDNEDVWNSNITSQKTKSARK